MGNAAGDLPMNAEEFLAVAMNVGMALRQHLKGSPCRTFMNDVKLRIEAADAYDYPDVMVTCSAEDARDPLVQREPVLLVEVLSPSTAPYDRGAKFAAYRRLPSLREVLFVDPETRLVDLFRLGEKGLWELHPTPPGGDVHLASVELTITAGVLWDEVPD